MAQENDWIATRASVCYQCPVFKRGQVRIETWCSMYDDDPHANRNCDSAKHGRWQARIVNPDAHCGKWTSTVIMHDQHPLLQQYRDLMVSPPQTPANLNGDGVIMALWETGNRAHLGIVLGCTLLRNWGWKGKIQLWNIGDYPKLDGLDVDLMSFPETQARTGEDWRSYIQWSAKSYAIRHSGLAKVQWIDWDAYHVDNPEKLFGMLDTNPFLFWAGGDPWRWRYNPYLHDAVYGLPIGHDCPTGPIQGGTYAIDCTKAWKLIELQRLQDSNSRMFYPLAHLTDEEGWRLSITALGFPALQPGPMPWRGPAWVNHVEHDPLVVHRCGAKCWADCCPEWTDVLPKEDEVRRVHTLLARQYGYGAASGLMCNQGKATVGNSSAQAQRLAAARATRGRKVPTACEHRGTTCRNRANVSV